MEGGLGGEGTELQEGRIEVLVFGRDFQESIEATFLKDAIKGFSLHFVFALAIEKTKHAEVVSVDLAFTRAFFSVLKVL